MNGGPPAAQSEPVAVYPWRLGNGLTRIIEAGSADDPMVLLIHGLGSRADRWRQNVVGLARRGFHVLAIDLPGHGFASKGPDAGYTPDAMAGMIGALISEMSADQPVHIVGTSLGGLIAVKIALTQPTVVDRLVLVGTLGYRPLGANRRRELAAGLTQTSPESIERKLRLLVRDQSMITPALIGEEIRMSNSPGAAQALAALADYVLTAIDDDLIATDLPAIAESVPTLLIWGRDDAFQPVEVGFAIADSVPGIRLVVIDGAGHAPFLEAAERFDDTVASFLTSPRASA